MWLKNLIVYRLPATWRPEADAFEARLAQQPLQPCGGFDMESRGWTCPRHDGEYLYRQARQWLIALGVEQKLLPASVIRQVTEERIAELARQQPYPVGRRQKRQVKDEVTAELLPRAFSRRRVTRAWIDPSTGLLAIDAAAAPRAEQFVEELRRADDGAFAMPLETLRTPSSAMAEWVASGEPPHPFSIDEDLELRAPDATKATVRYSRHNLHGKDIRDHIAAGKVPVRLGMTWNDRVSFVLTETLHLKRLSFLEILKREGGEEEEDEDERFDIDFALVTGELSQLIADLVQALGGEKQAGERAAKREPVAPA